MIKHLLTFLLFSFACRSNAHSVIELKVECDNGTKVNINYHLTTGAPIESLIIYRSFQDLSRLEVLDMYQQPITKLAFGNIASNGQFTDTLVAHNCTYYYYMKAYLSDGSRQFSHVVSCYIPDVTVIGPVRNEPMIFIDKINYCLEIRNGSSVIKRYPVSLGGNPFNRKLHYDSQSTPEGTYSIQFIKRESDFHKSIGVSYPNDDDRKRYAKAREEKKLPIVQGKIPAIGGSITIHGGGIGHNWTWGCIAMRNSDLDEIFSVIDLKQKIPILICGSEIKREALGRTFVR